MVFGQMNEPPGNRFEVCLTGVTLAESLQQRGKDVLLFVDNIFRFVQAGMEMSVLLGRIPSETGYQPTLAAEVSEFHERIRPQPIGSITTIEAVYVPSDDLTDPAVVAIFSHLDSITVLSRERVQLGLYPAIDPLLSSSKNLDSNIVGHRHYHIAQECRKILSKYAELKKIAAVNIDSDYAGMFLSETTPDIMYTYGMAQNAQIRSQNIRHLQEGTEFEIKMPSNTLSI